MSVTREDVLKIAKLAKLKFEDRALDSFTEQFQRILNYIEKLNELDTEDVAPTSHVTPFSAQEEEGFREDEVRPSLPREDVLATAPDPADAVPRAQGHSMSRSINFGCYEINHRRASQ